MNSADFFIGYIENFSYIGIFLFLIFAGNFIPIPEEVILLVVGYLASADIINLPLGIVVTLAGILIGDNLLYRIARSESKFADRMRKKVFSMPYIRTHKPFLEKHVRLVILISRMTPFLRLVGPVISGSMKLSPAGFQKYNFIGMVSYTPLVILAGYYGHQYFDTLLLSFDDLKHLVLLTLIVILTILVGHVIYFFATRNTEQ